MALTFERIGLKLPLLFGFLVIGFRVGVWSSDRQERAIASSQDSPNFA